MIAVWFSCGAASAVAAKKTIEIYGSEHEIRVVNNPVKEEHEDNRRFLKDVEEWIGIKIELAVNPKFPDASCKTVWSSEQWMGSITGGNCTLQLKKKARQAWEQVNKPDNFVLGFTADEAHRAKRFLESESDKMIPVLVNEGITKQHCFDIINQAGISLPEIYSHGFPNANCVGCIKATSPTYWNLVREKFPNEFADRAKQSREIGARLVRVKGKRIFLDELDPTAKGRPLKEYKIDCGIFCEEGSEGDD
jgi:hypothetical protein